MISLCFPTRAARLPKDRSEQIASGLAWLATVLLLTFIAAPLLGILGKALFDKTGVFIGLANFESFLNLDGFAQTVNQSVWIAFICTAIVLPLAYIFAASLTRTRMWGKPYFRYLALIPILAPSLLPAISLVYLFGNQGMLKELLPVGVSIYGPLGIVIGEVFYTFPHALMILIAALSLADARLYEAAAMLGAGPVKRWFSVTLPSVRYGLISAAFVVFTLVITDFGVPKVIGGRFNMLAVEAYKQVIGQQNFPKGAVIGILLLLPAILSFVIDHWAQSRQKALLTSRAVPLEPCNNALTDSAAFLLCSLIVGGMLIMLCMAMAAAFMQLWPYKLSLTLAHFDFEQMDGGGWLAYWNSLRMAGWTALIGTSTVFLAAFLTEKTLIASVPRHLIRVIALLPMAVPGLVLGLGYIFFFNNPNNPLHGLYGTMPILVVCTIAHFYTTAHLTARTALKQMDGEYEQVARSLQVPFWTTAWRVTIPVCLPAILETSRYYFVSAMTTVSAVVFLYAPDTVLCSIAVLNMDDAGDTAAAAAMATLIVITSALVCLLFSGLSYLLLKRTQAWRRR